MSVLTFVEYQIYCVTEQAWVTEWRLDTDPPPTTCKNDTSHTIIADSVAIVRTHVEEYPTDRSGKLRVHQTSRKLGTRICWTGVGDNPENPTSIGGGNKISYYHTVSGTDPKIKYIDFNCVENETWVHEGYITWKDAQLDELTLDVVTRVTSTAAGSNTNYDLYGGYLVVPNPYGTGSIEVTSDITTHSGGLVYMPDNDLGDPPVAFWNADWNSTTKKYENITAAPLGDGRYNMFATEITLSRILSSIPLLNSGFIAMNSSDTDQLGHGMRFKVTLDTNTTLTDFHEWSMASVLCLHRIKSI